MSSYTLTQRGDQTVLVLVGEADVAASGDLRAAVGWALASGPRVLVVDVDELSFIDCVAVGVLVGARRRMVDAGRDFVLINAQGLVRQVLDVVGAWDGHPAPAGGTDR